MPFIPHTVAETKAMLEAIGVSRMADLFDEIPSKLLAKPLTALPEAMTEMEIGQLMGQRARADTGGVIFIGAGAYDHHIPAAVWQLAARGEFYSAYTPYQAEASQGTLQMLYEYQSMMTALMAMEVSNASLYDGASGLAEAVLMAIRLHKKSSSRKVLVPRTLNPLWRSVVQSLVHAQGIELVEVPYNEQEGRIDLACLDDFAGQDFAALIIPQPNFFGVLEEVDMLTDWAQDQSMLSIGVVNPMAMALLKPPGEWGKAGVDICCGEGQPLGIPLSSGGPYFGFLCTRKAHVRQMPGRLIGKTLDMDGKPGFSLTLQAREQHIRRSKATSNICTNQGLMVTAATIYMSLMGAKGLANTVAASCTNTRRLTDLLCELPGVSRRFTGPSLHETALRLDLPVHEILKALAAHNVLGGFALGDHYDELEDVLLLCATEKRTQDEMTLYADKLGRVIKARTTASCPVRPKI